MRLKIKLIKTLLLTLFFIPFFTRQSRADIDGFNGFEGWELALGDNGTLPIIGENFITITTEGGQRRNIWFCQKQNITSFTATFTYEPENAVAVDFNTYGISFIVQGDPEGKQAVGGGGVALFGIEPSFGLTIELDGGDFANGPDTLSGAFFNGGATEGLPFGISAFENDSITIEVDYDGGQFLDVTYENSTEEFSRTFFLPDSIQEFLGSDFAYIGFGATTVPNVSVSQTLADFVYLETAKGILLGDVNLDGAVDLLDIAPFVSILTSSGFQDEADINQDGNVDLLDVAPLVDLLTGT